MSPKKNQLTRYAIGTWMIWAGLPVLLSGALVLVAWLLWLEDKTVSDENHLLENTQVFFLLCASVLHVRQRLSISQPLLRLCHVVLAWLCFSVLLREIDIQKFGSVEVWSLIELGIRSLAALGWLFLACLVGGKLRSLWAVRRQVVCSVNGLATAVAIGLYMVSYFFDKGHVPVDSDTSQFVEESLQLAATIFFFTGSLVPLGFARLSKSSLHL